MHLNCIDNVRVEPFSFNKLPKMLVINPENVDSGML
jgi:hypothetical protein